MSVGHTRIRSDDCFLPVRRPLRRSVLRQRLIDAEAGVRLSLRADGTFFFHLFVCCAVVSAALILGLSLNEWALLLVCFGLVVLAELLRSIAQRTARSLAALTDRPDWSPSEADSVSPSRERDEKLVDDLLCLGKDIQNIATAGAVLVTCCAIVVTGLILGDHVWFLFTGPA